MSSTAVARLGFRPVPLRTAVGKPPPIPPQNLRKTGAIRPCEQQDWERMLVLHLPQVRLVAKSIWDRSRFAVELDDLVGYGMIGLWSAVQRFDPSRGTLLKTYAEHRIRGAILDGLRGMDWLPRSARQKERQYQQKLREIEIASIRSAGNGTPVPLQRANGVPNNAGSSAPADRFPRMEFVFAAGNLTDLERLSEKSRCNDLTRNGDGNPESLYERKEEHLRLADAIAFLPRRHREVIELYYHRELSMKQIGRILRVHESRVSQLHAAAIHRLRNHLLASKGARAPLAKNAGPAMFTRRAPVS